MPNETPNKTKPSSSSSRSKRRRKPGPHRRKLHRRELSAGGIVYRIREGHAEFFFIKDPFGKWTFPKGHQELGETLAETAIREIEEETGLSGLRYVAPLGRTSFRFRRGKTIIDKSVHLFLFEASPEAKERLSGEEGIKEAKWFPVCDVSAVSGYRNLDVLLKKALDLTGSASATSDVSSGLV